MTLQQKLVRADCDLDMLKDKAKETDELAKENLQLRKKFDRAINELRKSDRKIERLKIDYQQANDIIVEQNNEIEILKDFNVKLQATKNRLDEYDRENQIRIDKAIEILGNWTIFETSAYTDKIISETLDILKGVEKE